MKKVAVLLVVASIAGLAATAVLLGWPSGDDKPEQVIAPSPTPGPTATTPPCAQVATRATSALGERPDLVSAEEICQDFLSSLWGTGSLFNEPVASESITYLALGPAAEASIHAAGLPLDHPVWELRATGEFRNPRGPYPLGGRISFEEVRLLVDATNGNVLRSPIFDTEPG